MEKPFIHDHALCESKNIGQRTRVWAFAHVLPGAVIGEDCNICDHVFIENDVTVGNRVTIKCGVQIWDGIDIEDDVFVGPNATFTNDVFPRSKVYPDKFLRTKVRKGASLGANCTILPGVTIGERAMVGAGSVVLKSVPPLAIVVGNPARIIGYANTTKETAENHSGEGAKSQTSKSQTATASKISNVKLVDIPQFNDMRGSLSVGEFRKCTPFLPKRYFVVFDVPSEEVRGEHAHRQCEQFLVCLRGSVSAVVDDGKIREEYSLDSPGKGLYIPKMVWGTQYKYSADSLLLVFASHEYDDADYIRNYADFLKEKLS